jgi:hypothetical protein
MIENRAPWWRRTENWAGILMSIAFHAACAALLRATWTAPSGAAAAPPAARYVYWVQSNSGSAPDAWDSDPRALRSPILFALPTLVGFSPGRKRITETHSWLRIPGENNLLLERVFEEPNAQDLHARTRGEAIRLSRARWLALDEIEEPYHALLGTPSAVHIEWVDATPDGLAGVSIELNPPPAVGERAWEASALLHISEAGEVVSVFLVKSTADRERNESIVRSLWTLRAAPGREGRYTVNLFYYPMPSAERAGAHPASL